MRLHLTAFLLAAHLAGCASLQDTRDFANAASELTAYRDLTEHWAATYERERLFLFDADLAQAKSEHDARQEIVPELLNVHATVARYFATLARLAGDESSVVGKSADAAAKSIKQIDLPGLDNRQVEAYSKLSNLIAAGYQRQLIASYVHDGDEPLQTLLSGMRLVLRAYKGTLNNELGRAAFLTLVDRDTPQGKTLAALANAEYHRIEADAAATRKGIDALDQAIIRIAVGHRKLADSTDFDRDDVKQVLRGVTAELQSLRAKIISIGGD
jgi:hypothetical protein